MLLEYCIALQMVIHSISMLLYWPGNLARNWIL